MKKQKFSILAIALVVFAASCKKNDFSSEAVSAPATTQAAVTTTTNWKSVSSWAAAKSDKFTTFSGQIADSSISAATAQKGLVLVFMKNGNTISSLPVQENENVYWYYQVAENNIEINADTYGTAQTMSNTSAFKYFVLSAGKVAELETAGHSRSELMSLTYEAAASLLK